MTKQRKMIASSAVRHKWVKGKGTMPYGVKSTLTREQDNWPFYTASHQGTGLGYAPSGQPKEDDATAYLLHDPDAKSPQQNYLVVLDGIGLGRKNKGFHAKSEKEAFKKADEALRYFAVEMFGYVPRDEAVGASVKTVLDRVLGARDLVSAQSSVAKARRMVMGEDEEGPVEEEDWFKELQAEIKAEKDFWTKVHKKFPDWPIGDLKDAAYSVSPTMSSEAQKVQKFVQDLRKKTRKKTAAVTWVINSTRASVLSAAKDTGSKGKDKGRRASLTKLVQAANKLEEMMAGNDGFPEVTGAVKAVQGLVEVSGKLDACALRLASAPANSEEAAMAQAELDDCRSSIDTMLPPLMATLETMEALLAASVALETQFAEMDAQTKALNTRLEGEKKRLSNAAKAVQNATKIG